MKKRYTLSKSQVREYQRKADELYRRGLIKKPINVDKYFGRTNPNSIDTSHCFKEVQNTFDEAYRRGWIKTPINVEKRVREQFLASQKRTRKERRKIKSKRTEERREFLRKYDFLRRRGMSEEPIFVDGTRYTLLTKFTTNKLIFKLLKGIRIMDKNTIENISIDRFGWKEFTQESERIVNWYINWFSEISHLENHHNRHKIYKSANSLIKGKIMESIPFELPAKREKSAFKIFCPFCGWIIPNRDEYKYLDELKFCPFCLEIFYPHNLNIE